MMRCGPTRILCDRHWAPCQVFGGRPTHLVSQCGSSRGSSQIIWRARPGLVGLVYDCNFSPHAGSCVCVCVCVCVWCFSAVKNKKKAHTHSVRDILAFSFFFSAPRAFFLLSLSLRPHSRIYRLGFLDEARGPLIRVELIPVTKHIKQPPSSSVPHRPLPSSAFR